MAGSRRNTPQPVADTTSNAEPSNVLRRSTRATRSQSRELSSDEDIGARRVKKESNQDRLRGQKTKAEKGRLPKSLKLQQDLSMVVEERSITYPELRDEEGSGAEEISEHAQQAQIGGLPDLTSPGGASAFSGTTVRASRNAQELEDLISEGLLDALPDLSSASDKLLDFLIPKNPSETAVNDIRQQLGSKNSRSSKNFQRLNNAFNVQREIFGSGLFVDLRKILKALVDLRDIAESTPGPWRPDALLQKANVAALTAKILTSSSASEVDHFWEELDQYFPNYFVTDRVDFESPQTFQLALEIRTQYAVTQLTQRVNQSDFDSDKILAQIFNERGESFRGWDCDGMRADDLPKKFKKTLLLRFSEIRGKCQKALQPSPNNSELTTVLLSSFPWAKFSYVFVTWAKGHVEELKDVVNQNGGTEIMVRSLSDEIQRRKGSQSARQENPTLRDESPRVVLDFEPPSEISNSISVQSEISNAKKTRVDGLKTTAFSSASPKLRVAAVHLNSKRNIRKEEKEKAQTNPQQPEQDPVEIQVISTAGPSNSLPSSQRHTRDPHQVISSALTDAPDEPQVGRNDDWQQALGDDDGNEDEDEDEDNDFQMDDRAVDRVLAMSSQLQAESNKENEIQPTLSTIGDRKGKRLIDAQPNARRISSISQDQDLDDQEDQSGDLSQDEGFQQPRLPPNTLSSHVGRTPVKRRAIEASTAEPSPAKRSRLQANQRTSQARDSQPRVLQEHQVPQSQAQKYLDVKAAAKTRVAGRPKAPQMRTPWSEEEIERLITLIEEYGVSYAVLKKQDDEQGKILDNRDQVAIKDKARNMKVDYLKSGRHLPRNFEKIPLSVSLVGRLAAMGIEYDRITGHRIDGIWEPGQGEDDEE